MTPLYSLTYFKANNNYTIRGEKSSHIGLMSISALWRCLIRSEKKWICASVIFDLRTKCFNLGFNLLVFPEDNTRDARSFHLFYHTSSTHSCTMNTYRDWHTVSVRRRPVRLRFVIRRRLSAIPLHVYCDLHYYWGCDRLYECQCVTVHICAVSA